jgi:hypothetical protein
MTRRFAPKPAIFNVNNFFKISICKPENFLTFPPPPYHPRWFSSQIRRQAEWPDQRIAVQQKAESAEKPHERTERHPENRNYASVQGGWKGAAHPLRPAAHQRSLLATVEDPREEGVSHAFAFFSSSMWAVGFYRYSALELVSFAGWKFDYERRTNLDVGQVRSSGLVGC